jgi:hypothetical protein
MRRRLLSSNTTVDIQTSTGRSKLSQPENTKDLLGQQNMGGEQKFTRWAIDALPWTRGMGWDGCSTTNLIYNATRLG